MISTLTALALLSAASAQSTVSLFFPAAGGDLGVNIGLDASATVSGSLTSYVLNCASITTASSAPMSTAASDVCAYISDFSIVEGRSTMLYSSMVEGVTVTVDCSIGGTTTAVCTDRANGTDLTSTTFASSEMLFYPVTVTAGDAQATGATSASGSASKTAASGSSASTKAAATGASPTSTGGVPQMTAGVWVLGAGAMMAAVAVL